MRPIGLTGRNFDIVIVGAGVIGTTMASLLVALRLAEPGRIAVIANRSPTVTPSTPTDWDLRVFALNRASQRVLKISGAWQSLPPQKRCAYEKMCVWDARGLPGGAGSVGFDAAEMGEPNLGFIVEGRALQAQCLASARNSGVVFMEAAIEGVRSADPVRIRLSDGRELGCHLLIAADGTESATRGLLGIETAGHAYHQDALVAHVRTTLPHQSTAWQRFLSGGPLAFLPMPDGRSSIVWSMNRREATRLQALDAAAFGAALTAASASVLGPCEVTTPIAAFPLKLQHAADYVRPRAVLIGDAAHVVHPLAGQGLNLGLLDCASLAEALSEAGSAGFFGEHRLLRRYERRRRSENLATAVALDGLERVFSSSDPLLSGLRRVGMSAIDRMPFVKRGLAARALGVSGDIPALLRSEPA